MTTIQAILDKYRQKIDRLDLELLIAHELKKSREFILAHPEETVDKKQESGINKLLTKRLENEPLAYILGQKEFYGLDFRVTRDTLIPRPETELLVETAICNLPTRQAGMEHITCSKNEAIKIIDIGTGSGNIIISIAKTIASKNLLHACLSGRQASGYMLYGIDISQKALKIAKYNAKKLGLDKKIKFIHGNLLDPLIGSWKLEIGNSRMIILANLPYLSKEIYSATAPTVKNFEPKSALYSPKAGLGHYEKLLKQIQDLKRHCYVLHITCFMEFSPEQKKGLTGLVKKILPSAKIQFKQDLAGKWRICMLELI
ncbi:MAG: peptide chain release factor N(5)-glutamine methyltransferase [Candidatus Moraniibacteriota bacterium]